MTLAAFPFNNTAGVTATTANTGAFVLASGTGSTQKFASAAAHQGATGLEFVSTGAAVSAFRFRFAGNAQPTRAAFSVRFKIPAAVPSATQTFFEVVDSAGSRVLQLEYTNAGLVKTNDKANTSLTILTAAQAPAGAWFRFETVVSALSATAGAFTVRAYSSGSTQVGTTATSTTANLGTVSLDGCYIGAVATIAGTIDIDSLQLNDGATTEIGEYTPTAANVAPAVSAGPDQTVQPGTVTLTGSASDSDGTVASRHWTCTSYPGATAPTLTGATTNTVSFTGVAGVYTLQFTATDDQGASSSDTANVYVQAATVTPSAAVENSGGWTGSYTDIADGSDSTFIASTGTGSFTAAFAPATPNTSATLTVRARQTGAGSAVTINLLNNSTVVGTWQLANLTTTFTDYPLALTKTQVAAITDWNNVRFQAVS